MEYAEISWPMLPDGERPIWTNDRFEIAGKPCEVPSYHQNESNWSEELTSLHEEEAGSRHPIDVASRQLAIESVSAVAARGGLVLDVGCSSGFWIEELRKFHPAARPIGADYIMAPLVELARRTPGFPILQFDLRHCPLPDGFLNGVVALNVLEHIDDDHRAVAEMARILAPGGIMHIEVPAGPLLYDIYDEHLMHHRRYQLADLVRIIESAGMDVIKRTHLGVAVFPMFAAVKLRNRAKLNLPSETKKALVASQIRHTSQSRLLKALLKIELALGKNMEFPFGIRCIVVARKK